MRLLTWEPTNGSLEDLVEEKQGDQRVKGSKFLLYTLDRDHYREINPRQENLSNGKKKKESTSKRYASTDNSAFNIVEGSSNFDYVIINAHQIPSFFILDDETKEMENPNAKDIKDLMEYISGKHNKNNVKLVIHYHQHGRPIRFKGDNIYHTDSLQMFKDRDDEKTDKKLKEAQKLFLKQYPEIKEILVPSEK